MSEGSAQEKEEGGKQEQQRTEVKFFFFFTCWPKANYIQVFTSTASSAVDQKPGKDSEWLRMMSNKVKENIVCENSGKQLICGLYYGLTSWKSRLSCASRLDARVLVTW